MSSSSPNSQQDAPVEQAVPAFMEAEEVEQPPPQPMELDQPATESKQETVPTSGAVENAAPVGTVPPATQPQQVHLKI